VIERDLTAFDAFAHVAICPNVHNADHGPRVPIVDRDHMSTSNRACDEIGVKRMPDQNAVAIRAPDADWDGDAVLKKRESSSLFFAGRQHRFKQRQERRCGLGHVEWFRFHAEHA
jgi:hypothetical protein